jgi:hypothetical protein
MRRPTSTFQRGHTARLLPSRVGRHDPGRLQPRRTQWASLSGQAPSPHVVAKSFGSRTNVGRTGFRLGAAAIKTPLRGPDLHEAPASVGVSLEISAPRVVCFPPTAREPLTHLQLRRNEGAIAATPHRDRFAVDSHRHEKGPCVRWGSGDLSRCPGAVRIDPGIGHRVPCPGPRRNQSCGIASMQSLLAIESASEAERGTALRMLSTVIGALPFGLVAMGVTAELLGARLTRSPRRWWASWSREHCSAAVRRCWDLDRNHRSSCHPGPVKPEPFAAVPPDSADPFYGPRRFARMFDLA